MILLSKLLIFLHLSHFSFSIKVNPSRVKMQITSKTLKKSDFKPGVAPEVLQDPIFYTKYIPIIFQLKVPELSVETLRLNSSLHCSSEASDDLCPVAFHLEKLLNPLADNMRFSKNMYTPSESIRKFQNKPGYPYFGPFSCQYIDSHFLHLSTHSEDLPRYLDKLKSSCPLAKDLKPILTTHFSPLSTDHITNASINFKKLSQNGDALLEMAGFTALQTALILMKYVDTIRWHYAYNQCLLNSKLSFGIVDTFMLRSALRKVHKTAESHGYRLSVPYLNKRGDTDVSIPLYYELPLTDCIMGIQTMRKTELLVRLLVPVVKKESMYTRFRLLKIPYLITEESGQKKICEVEGFSAKDDFLIENILGSPGSPPHITISPECVPGEICHLSEQPRPLVIDPCLRALLYSDSQEIKNFCSYECFPVENEELMFPIIIRLSSNQYSITGRNKEHNVNIFCNQVLFHVLQPNETNGVLQVTLPCNCDIHYKSNIYSSLCNDTSSFEINYISSFPILLQEIQEELLTPKHSTEESLTQEEEEVLVSSPEEIKPLLSSHNFTPIWILIFILISINCFLFCVAYKNRLIDLGLIREIIGRFGYENSTPPRSRLEEENNPRNNNVVQFTANGNNSNFNRF